MEYLSQKQIADRFGVPKQKIYRCIKLNHIKEAHSEVVKGNTVLMYDKQAIEQIESILKGGATTSSEAHSEAHSEVHHEAVNEALNEAVLKQLDILNEQLKAKDKQIENLTKLLDQEQQLNAMNQQKILALETKLEEPTEPVEPDEEAQKGFWTRFFKK